MLGLPGEGVFVEYLRCYPMESVDKSLLMLYLPVYRTEIIKYLIMARQHADRL